MQKKLSILIINFNSSDFIELNLYALQKLTLNPYNVLIVDNKSPLDDFYKLQKICSNYTNVFLERRNINLVGSAAHGDSLNYLFPKIRTPYFCILDPDAVWLKKNWDRTLIDKLGKKVKVIGTQAPVKSDKYQDFPLVFGALFETAAFKKLKINCLPPDLNKNQDVCFELRDKYLNAGFEGKNIQMKNTRYYKKGPFSKVICAEYYLNGNFEKIFASHFARGSTSGANKYNRGIKKYIYRLPVFGQYLLKIKGQQEKKLWISIAKKIIDSESVF